MLTLVPILFLILSAVAVRFLRNLERGQGYSWMTAILTVLAAWGGVMALHWLQPDALVMTHWRPFDPIHADPIIFQWDAISWPYAFFMVGLLLAIILTAPVRFQYKSNPVTWSANLVFVGLSLFPILAATPLAVVVAWTVLDVVELVFVLGVISDWRFRREVVIEFVSRVFGTFLLLATMIYGYNPTQPLLFENLQPAQGALILAAVLLRMGVIPLNLPYVRQLPLQHGLTNTLRIVTQISALVILARIPTSLVSETWPIFFFTLTAAACLYGGLLWLIADNEINGRPYWFIATGSLAFLTVLQGNGPSSVLWGIALLGSGALLFVFSTRKRGLLILPALGLLTFTGLPFTPVASAWQATAPQGGWVTLTIVTVGLLASGYIRHALRPGEPFVGFERWAQTLYVLGLGMLSVSSWVAIYLGQGLTTGRWWAGVIVLVICAASSWVFGFRQVRENPVAGRIGWFIHATSRVGTGIGNFLRFGWLGQIFRWFFRLAQQLILLITGVLEGEGGVLWALLLLALLLTLLTTMGGSI